MPTEHTQKKLGTNNLDRTIITPSQTSRRTRRHRWWRCWSGGVCVGRHRTRWACGLASVLQQWCSSPLTAGIDCPATGQRLLPRPPSPSPLRPLCSSCGLPRCCRLPIMEHFTRTPNHNVGKSQARYSNFANAHAEFKLEEFKSPPHSVGERWGRGRGGRKRGRAEEGRYSEQILKNLFLCVYRILF